jgi:hypothetical protein
MPQVSRRVSLKRLIFVCVLKAERLSGFGRGCIPEVVTFARHLHERLTCCECLRRLPVKLQNNFTFEDINKPRCRMEVRSGRRTRRDVSVSTLFDGTASELFEVLPTSASSKL